MSAIPAPQPDPAPVVGTPDADPDTGAVPEPRSPGDDPAPADPAPDDDVAARGRWVHWRGKAMAALAVAASLASIYPVAGPPVERLLGNLVGAESGPAQPFTTLEGVREGGQAVLCQRVYGEFDSPPPASHAYWIFVKDMRLNTYYTQEQLRFDPMDRRNWDAVMWVGDRSPTFVGRPFVIYVVMMPVADSRPKQWTGEGIKFEQLRPSWKTIADLPVTRGTDNAEC